MIIDGLTHLTSSGIWLDGASDCRTSTLLQQMDEAGVDKAIVTALNGAVSNDELLEAAQGHLDRLILFAAPDLTADPDEEMQRLKSAGFTGLKLHPRFGRFSAADELVSQLVTAAVKHSLPVVLCSLCGNRLQLDFATPHQVLAQWCDQHPSHPFILAHAGSHQILDAWTLARNRENMYLDVSHTLHYFDGSSVQQDLAFVARRLDRRILFGSDFPECSIPDAMRRMEDLLGPWDEADRDAILGGTWEKILARG